MKTKTKKTVTVYLMFVITKEGKEGLVANKSKERVEEGAMVARLEGRAHGRIVSVRLPLPKEKKR